MSPADRTAFWRQAYLAALQGYTMEGNDPKKAATYAAEAAFCSLEEAEKASEQDHKK